MAVMHGPAVVLHFIINNGLTNWFKINSNFGELAF